MDLKELPKTIVYTNEKDLSNRTEVTKLSFSIFFNQMLSKLNEQTGKKIKKKEIACMLGISSEMFRKYVNKEKLLKKRDCVIAICAMLQADTSDTNDGLYYYDNMDELNDYNPRDELLMNILDEQSNSFLSIDQINEKLRDNGFYELDIIDHHKIKPSYPFKVLKKKVECRFEELLIGDLYDSLDTAYGGLCSIYAFMLLDDDGRKEYELRAEPDGFLSCTEYPMKGDWYHKYDSLEETGVFKNCFIELLQMARAEKRKMAKPLNDTRNYHERISAKVINNELHVFYEIYNYNFPELGEFYLMDYVDGKYTLYVSHESRFMKFYLSKQEYQDMFGTASDKYDEKYTSIEEIQSAVEDPTSNRAEIIILRFRAFQNAQDKINALINDLRCEKAHIRNLKRIIETSFDSALDVLSFYQVQDDFQCIYDEYGVIIGIGVDRASFTLSDESHIELSVDDLCAGFELGLCTIEEIGEFLIKHKTLKITELLVTGTC